MEARLGTRFIQLVRAIQSNYVISEIRSALEDGRTAAASRIVRDNVVDFASELSAGFRGAAGVELSIINAALGRTTRALAIGFDAGDPEAAKLMRSSELEFISNFTTGQVQSTRQALTRSLRAGWGTQKTARAIRDSMGLTPYQEQIVSNYREGLEDQDSDVLNRMLRDRRFDGQIENAFENEEPLGAKSIDRMVEAYRQGWIRFRAETIARTETLKAVSQARHEALRQASESAGFDTDTVRRTWNATLDDRTRDTHADMDGQTVVGMDTPFESSSGAQLLYPGDPDAPPEEIINCRCVLTFEYPSEEEVQSGRANQDAEEE